MDGYRTETYQWIGKLDEISSVHCSTVQYSTVQDSVVHSCKVYVRKRQIDIPQYYKSETFPKPVSFARQYHKSRTISKLVRSAPQNHNSDAVVKQVRSAPPEQAKRDKMDILQNQKYKTLVEKIRQGTLSGSLVVPPPPPPPPPATWDYKSPKRQADYSAPPAKSLLRLTVDDSFATEEDRRSK